MSSLTSDKNLKIFELSIFFSRTRRRTIVLWRGKQYAETQRKTKSTQQKQKMKHNPLTDQTDATDKTDQTES
jgi:hypothetical protein